MTVQSGAGRSARVLPLPRVRLTARQFDGLVLALGALAVGLVSFAFGLWGSGGHLAPPLDDTFIHFQYARQLAAGHPWQYNTGDPPSSGASAFLYPLLLAPAYLLGLGGLAPLVLADALNLLAHGVAIVLLYDLARRIGGRPVALTAAWLLLLDGRLNWSFVTGMETGLYTAGLIAFAWAWLREAPAGRWGWTAATGALVALLRPEGHLLVSAVCLLTLAGLVRRGVLTRQAGWLLLPVIAGLLPYGVNLALTGQWQFNTAIAKSPWYTPTWPWAEKLRWSLGTLGTATQDIYLGLARDRSPFPPLAALCALGGVILALRRPRLRLFHVALIFIFTGGVALTLGLPPAHFYRYMQPYDWIFTLYVALGLVALVTALGRRLAGGWGGWARRGFYGGAAALAVLLLWPQFTAFLGLTAGSTRDIYNQQMAFAAWLRANTPPGARIGVNDVGAQKYLSDRYTVDLAGLTTNALRGVFMSGWGSVYEALAGLPEAQRPQYLLIHPDVFLNNTAESVSQGLLTPLHSITVQNPTITAGPTETLYHLNWEYTLRDPTRPHLLYTDTTPLDALNVADLADEARHGYRLVGRDPDRAEPPAIVTTAAYAKKEFALTEGGRAHTGWEAFTMRSVPGRPLVLLARARLAAGADQMVQVAANGQPVGAWPVHNDRGGAWQEYALTIPAAFVHGPATVIRLSVPPGAPGFTSYRYWVYVP